MRFRVFKRFCGAVGVSGLLLAGLVSPVALAAPPTAPRNALAEHEARLRAALRDVWIYEKSHGTNIQGIASVYAKHGLILRTPPGNQRTPSTSSTVRPASVSSDAFEAALSVPSDAFNVGVGVIWDPTAGFYTLIGGWGFRDDYVNGSAPDDVASLSVRSQCWKIIHTGAMAWDYQWNDVSNLVSIANANADGDTAFNIHDQTSGFVMYPTYGNAEYDFTRVSTNCDPYKPDLTYAFNYEHNQDGGNVLSIQINLGILAISYGGGPSTLQKSTGILSYPGQVPWG